MAFTNRHPIVRGMMSYGVMWPTASIIQQTIAGKTWGQYDWVQSLRYSFYGGVFRAPALYAWNRFTGIYLPATNLRTSARNALLGQVTFLPTVTACFFVGMCLLEGRTTEEAKHNLEDKFVHTYTVSWFFWPLFQTMSFYVEEKNRVPYLSVCSLFWFTFMAYMHELELKKR